MQAYAEFPSRATMGPAAALYNGASPAFSPFSHMDHLLAAVDLGSNSFRLSIGRVVQQEGAAQIYQIDRLKETVRLAAGLDADKRLSGDAVDRAIMATRNAVFPLYGLDPHDPRD